MGKISEMSDDLLVKILSYLPTKVAVSTSVLSKQWQFLWMWLSNLEFPNTVESESQTLPTFLLRNLPLYRASVLERFSLHLNCLDIGPEDVKQWIQFAISHDVRDLEIRYYSSNTWDDDTLPSSLYTCKSLVTLKLYGIICMYVPRMVCLPFLKTLLLEDVCFGRDDSLSLLLSNCHVLEDLSLYKLLFGDAGKLMVRVPSLQLLSLYITDDLDELVIDTPSLRYLKLEFGIDTPSLVDTLMNMPKLKEAVVSVSFTMFAKLIGSIPSVKSLTLCLSFDDISEVMFDDGFVFNKLKHLKFCTCEGYSTNVLVKLLEVSPNLRELELFTMDGHGVDYTEYWNQPIIVPECILSSLETFKWSKYRGRKEERELLVYILLNVAHRIKTATILDMDVFCTFQISNHK